MASPSVAIIETDTYYVLAEKNMLRMFETTTFISETPQGNPTFEDDQGNICLDPTLLQPPIVFNSFYPKSKCTALLYEREQDLSGMGQNLNFHHWPKVFTNLGEMARQGTRCKGKDPS